MDTRLLKGAFFSTLIVSAVAFAAAGKVTILSPVDGATVDSKSAVAVQYDADPGPDGDHLHLYADGKKVDVIHQLKGTAEVPPLTPGKHEICLVVNTKGHVATGVQACVNVTSK